MIEDEAPARGDENEKTAKRRPFWKRSGLWRREEAIRLMIAQGYSYEQIRAELHLSVTARQVSNFCAISLGIRSRGGAKQVGRRAAQEAGSTPAKRAGQGAGDGPKSESAAPAAPQQVQPKPASSVKTITEAFADEPDPIEEMVNRYKQQ